MEEREQKQLQNGRGGVKNLYKQRGSGELEVVKVSAEKECGALQRKRRGRRCRMMKEEMYNTIAKKE